jgi:hypothetical protein
MTRFVSFLLAVAATAILAVPAATGGPITKQNGDGAVFSSVTSICTIPSFVNYGFCGGNPQAFTDITGQLNAVQPTLGVYNLELTFGGLVPGATYRLYGNQNPAPPTPGVVIGFFLITSGVAGGDGKIKFKYQTTNPANLGFDLNRFVDGPDFTVATTYWSNQRLQVKPDGTLFVP